MEYETVTDLILLRDEMIHFGLRSAKTGGAYIRGFTSRLIHALKSAWPTNCLTCSDVYR